MISSGEDCFRQANYRDTILIYSETKELFSMRRGVEKVTRITTSYHEKGQEEEALRMAKKLLSMNMDIDKIVELTELSKEKLKQLIIFYCEKSEEEGKQTGILGVSKNLIHITPVTVFMEKYLKLTEAEKLFDKQLKEELTPQELEKWEQLITSFRKKGIKIQKLRIAKKMLAKGMTTNKILELTELPKEEIETLNLTRYSINLVHLSEENGGGWLAEVPELDGCISDGKTPQEALNNVQDVIRSWVEVAQERNQQIPEPKLYKQIWHESLNLIQLEGESQMIRGSSKRILGRFVCDLQG